MTWLLVQGALAMHGYNFTERVRKVLAMAREDAVRLRHEYVGTEHILLGLIREGEGVATTVLQNLAVDPVAIQQNIEATVTTGNAAPDRRPDLPYTSRAKKVLELAMTEARDLGHSYVGTEHLLLGLLCEEKGIAAQVLVAAGVTLETARAETLRLLGTELQRTGAPVAPNGAPSARFDAPHWAANDLLVRHRLTLARLLGAYIACVAGALLFLYLAVRVVRAAWRS